MHSINKKLFVIFIIVFLLGLTFNCFSQSKKEIKRWGKNEKKINKVSDPIEKIKIYQKFINKYKDNFFVLEAKERISEIEFVPVKKIDTIKTYLDFIENHKASKFAEIARIRIESIEYQKVKDTDNIDVYREFIKKYPKSKYKEEVDQRIEKFTQKDYDEAKVINTIETYEKFIKEHPESNFVEEANGKIKEIILKDIKIIKLICNTSPGYFYNPINYIARNLKREGFQIFTEKSPTYDITVTLDYKESQQSQITSQVKEGVIIKSTGVFWALIQCNIKIAHDKLGDMFKIDITCSSEQSKLEGPRVADRVKWDRLFKEAVSKLKHQLNKIKLKDLINKQK